MSELYNEIVNNRGSFERLIARIPGFRGYQDKQARRTADEAVRDYVANLMSQRVDRLIRIEQLILDKHGIAYMPRTRNVKGKMQQYLDSIQAAAPGYSGMWAQMKIGEDELEKIYAFDEALIQYVERFDAVLDTLQDAAATGEGIDAALIGVDDAATNALNAFALRTDVLTNFRAEL
jgi:hypothetical protein